MSDYRNTLVYRSNNSGGSWWLTDDDWRKLEEAGWKVEWFKDQTDRIFPADADGRWLGALAAEASAQGTNPDALIDQWERITGQNSEDEGCNCCGEPHNFTWYDRKGKAQYSFVEVVKTSRGWS